MAQIINVERSSTILIDPIAAIEYIKNCDDLRIFMYPKSFIIVICGSINKSIFNFQTKPNAALLNLLNKHFSYITSKFVNNVANRELTPEIMGWILGNNE